MILQQNILGVRETYESSSAMVIRTVAVPGRSQIQVVIRRCGQFVRGPGSCRLSFECSPHSQDLKPS
jgi:hypothetical protein